MEEPALNVENVVLENQQVVATPQKTIKEAFDFALLIKKKIVGNSTYKAYYSISL